LPHNDLECHQDESGAYCDTVAIRYSAGTPLDEALAMPVRLEPRQSGLPGEIRASVGYARRPAPKFGLIRGAAGRAS